MDLRRLVRVTLFALVAAFAITAVATPPDAVVRALALSLLLLVFVPVGYVLDAVRHGDVND